MININKFPYKGYILNTQFYSYYLTIAIFKLGYCLLHLSFMYKYDSL